MLRGLLLAACAAALVSTPTAAAAEPPAAAAAVYRGPDLAAQREAMNRLAPMVGRWRGEGQIVSPRPMTVWQTERVEFDLDGLVLVVHGTGFQDQSETGKPVFRAMAVMSYDDRRALYEVRSYNDGRTVTAEGRFLDDGRFEWSMSPPGVMIRYRIDLSDGRWRETGEMSRDAGATWTRTVTLDLSRAD